MLLYLHFFGSIVFLLSLQTTVDTYFKPRLLETQTKICGNNKPCKECGRCFLPEENDNIRNEKCDTALFSNAESTLGSPTFTNNCDQLNTCDPNPCAIQNIGTNGCVELFGSWYCDCKDKFYSHDCSQQNENVHKNDYASYIYVMYAPYSQVFDKVQFIVIIRNPGKHLEVQVDHGLGFVSLQDKHSPVLDIPSILCHKCRIVPYRLCNFLEKSEKHSIFIFGTTYPLILKEDADEIKEFHKTRIGRRYKVTVKVLNKLQNIDNYNPVQFFREYPKIILYDQFEGDECIPKVVLKGCSKDINKPTFTYRPNRKTIDSKVNIDKSCNATINRKWIIWELGVNFDEQDVPVSKTVDKESFVFEPYLYKYSKYLIKFYGIFNDGEIYLHNIDYCIHEIRALELVPVISGGSARHVFYRGEILLDARDSRDPNNSPDDQGHLRYTWKCDEIEPFCKETTVATPKHVVSGSFKTGHTYKFELTLSSVNGDMEPKTVYQNIFITGSALKNILIWCKKNCGNSGSKSSIYEVTYLVAIIEDTEDIDEIPLNFRWTYIGGGAVNETSVEDLAKEDTPPSILIIPREKLKADTNYTFSAKLSDDKGSASFTIITSPYPKMGNCSISPLEGILGETKFTISCENFQSFQQAGGLSYELFQHKANASHNADLYYGTEYDGKFDDIILLEELITVRIVDAAFMFVEVNFTINLTSRSFSYDEMDVKLGDVVALQKSGDRIGVVRKVCVIGALLNYTKSIEEFCKVCFRAMNEIELIDMDAIKMMAGGLEFFLESMAEEEGLPPYFIDEAGHILRKVGSAFKAFMTDKLHQETPIEYRVIKQVSEGIIGSADLIMKKKHDINLFNSPVMTNDMESLQLNYKEAFVSMMESLEMLAEAGGHRLLPYEDSFKMNSPKISVWAQIHSTAKDVSGLVAEDTNKSQLLISPTLAEELMSKPGPVVVEVVDMTDNPYWWYTGLNNDVQSNILALKLRKKHANSTRLHRLLNNSIDIYLTLKNDINVAPINGTAQRVDQYDDADTKDLAVSVHRIETPLGSKLLLDFTSITHPLKVLVLKDKIPDYDYMEELATSVTVENPTYHVNDKITESVSFFYIGVLPENTGNVTGDQDLFDYSFKVVTLNCKVWRDSIFSNKGCEVMHDSTSTLLHCQCTHLSTFGGAEIVAPHLINPITDLKLFLTLKDNPTVFIVISTVLILYILLLIWAQYKDREAHKQRIVVVLDDNYPGEKFGYLITVYTGARIRAGTNANVGIRLYGSIRDSRAHILKSKDRATMQRNNDDWFLMFTRVHLGEILNLHLWHDNVGGHADWFCEKILVYDLETQEEYVFLVDQWMSPAEHEYLEVYIAPVPRNTVQTRGKLTFENALLGFREMHVWASIINRHPRSSVTRAHRLAVCMCAIMVIMLTSIMYYDIFEVPEDEPFFSLNWRELQVTIQSAIIATPIVALVLYLFEKTEKKQVVIKDVEGDHLSIISKEKKGDIASKKSMSHSVKDKTTEEEPEEEPGKAYTAYSKFVRKFIKTQPLNPVEVDLNREKPKVEKKGWLIAAWVASQLVIFICGFFIIMYGLKLGKVRSELWLVTVASGIGQDIFLSTPLKILIVAFMLGFAHGRLFEVETYDLNTELAIRRDLVGNREYLKELGLRRADPMYHPLSRTQILAFRAQRKQYVRWGMFLEFLIILCFSISLIFLVTKTYSAKYYLQNEQLKKALTKPLLKDNITVGFDDVIDIKSLKEYLRLTLLPKLYKVMWYNNKPTSNFEEKFGTSGWFVNEAHRLIGVPRIRQIRVREDACVLADLIIKADLKSKCSASLSDSTEEKRNFKISWQTEDKDKNPLPSPWVYVTEEESGAIGLRGYSGQLYHPGGYVVNLGRTLKESNFTLTEVQYSDWLNVYSRFVILEMTLYNVNANSFSLAQLILENLPGGIIIRKSQVLTLQVIKEWGAWAIIFVLFTIYFIFRNLYTLNQQGFLKYCSQFWNFFEVLILAMCLLNFFIQIAHVVYSSDKIQEFQIAGKESFYKYTALIYYYHIIEIMLSALVVCCTIRLLKTVKLGPNSYITFQTIMLSIRSVFCITLVFIICLLIQSVIIAHRCNEPFSNTWGQFFTYKTAYRQMLKNAVFAHKRLAVFIYCLSAAGFSLVFIVLYSHYFRIAKGYRILKHETLNYFTFFVDQLIACLSSQCCKANELPPDSETVSTRLRGGMDTETVEENLPKAYEDLMKSQSIKCLKAHIRQIKKRKNSYLQTTDNSNFNKRTKQRNLIVEYEANPGQYFKFKISNLDDTLSSIISKIDDMLLDDNVDINTN